jgi:hypothetical protein
MSTALNGGVGQVAISGDSAGAAAAAGAAALAAANTFTTTGAYGAWTAPAYGSNSGGAAAAPFQYRTAPGNTIQLRRQIAFTGAIVSGATVATVPAPPKPVQFQVRWSGSGAAAVFVNIDVAGLLSFATNSLVSGNAASFDGLSYSLDA